MCQNHNSGLVFSSRSPLMSVPRSFEEIYEIHRTVLSLIKSSNSVLADLPFFGYDCGCISLEPFSIRKLLCVKMQLFMYMYTIDRFSQRSLTQ